MILTKYQHACTVLTVNDQRLVIDPGVWTDDFVLPKDVVAIVITHNHPDHNSPELLQQLQQAFPEAALYGPSDVANDALIPVAAGDTAQVGPFTLEFFGGEHAHIDKSMPVPQNLGVLVNEYFYHPGDSFAVPSKPVAVLALPVTAPWMKVAESLDFLRAIKPKLAFPIHDAIANKTGQDLVDRLHGAVAQEVGCTYQRFDASQPVTLP